MLLHTETCFPTLFHVVFFHVDSCYFILYHIVSCWFMVFRVVPYWFVFFLCWLIPIRVVSSFLYWSNCFRLFHIHYCCLSMFSCWFTLYLMFIHIPSCCYMVLHIFSCWLMLLHFVSRYFISIHAVSCPFVMIHAVWCWFILPDVFHALFQTAVCFSFCFVKVLQKNLIYTISYCLPLPLNNGWSFRAVSTITDFVLHITFSIIDIQAKCLRRK